MTSFSDYKDTPTDVLEQMVKENEKQMESLRQNMVELKGKTSIMKMVLSFRNRWNPYGVSQESN